MNQWTKNEEIIKFIIVYKATMKFISMYFILILLGILVNLPIIFMQRQL
uniref:Uncharacterized protein n=1 Tax=Tetranychus urticae TaxID=32264 RepID=T1KKU9_TETUR